MGVRTPYESGKAYDLNGNIMNQTRGYYAEGSGTMTIDSLVYSCYDGGDEMNTDVVRHVVGRKDYELTNHLGNVMTVVSDKRTVVNDTTSIATVNSSTDYWAFGSILEGRSYESQTLKWGFNGKLNENEAYAKTGTLQDYGMRYYLTELGRFLTVDPITKKYPELTPYQFASNSPVQSIDLDGLEEMKAGKVDPTTGYNTTATDATSRPGSIPIDAKKLKKAGNASAATENANSNQTYLSPQNNSNAYYHQDNVKNRASMQKFEGDKQKLMETDAVAYGSSTTGLGLVQSLHEGMQQMPTMMLEGYLVETAKSLKIGMSFKEFSKATSGTFKGASHNAMRSLSYEIYKNKKTLQVVKAVEMPFKSLDYIQLYQNISTPPSKK